MTEATLPCIYGEIIHKDCPVQIFLLQPNIQKYKQTNDPVLAQAKAIGEVLANANNMTFIQLAAFCNACPHLHAYKLREMKK